MPASRERTIRMTTARLNSTCAATIVVTPMASCGASSPNRPATTGFRTSNTVTKAISVAMPMTTPGTMMAT